MAKQKAQARKRRHLQEVKAQKKRSVWIKPLSTMRKKLGQFDRLMPVLIERDPAAFRRYSRFMPELYEKLLERLTPRLEKKTTRMREPLEPGLKLAVTLRYLASGSSYPDLSYGFCIASNTVSVVVREVCQAIIDELGEEFLDCPSTPQEWKQVADSFETRWNFPHCCGAVDGKHINMKNPPGGGSLYFNYKKHFSIVLMAVVDAKYRFLYIEIGQPGGISDGGVWNHTDLAQALVKGEAGFPEPKKLPGEESEEAPQIPYFLVGDDAFALRSWLMKPYPYKDMDIEHRRYNYRLSRARRVVENAFGILAMRFRCLRTNMEQHPQTVEKVIHAACILHNLLRESIIEEDGDRVNPDNGEVIEGRWRNDPHNLYGLQASGGNTGSNTVKLQRAHLTSYFSGIGSVSWQDSKI